MTRKPWPPTDLLSQRASTTPERTALIAGDTGRAWTYRELDREAAAVATALDAEAGDRIGTLLPTGPALVITTFAVARSGGTLVLLSPEESVAALSVKEDQASLDVLLCSDETAGTAVELAGKCEIGPVYSMGDGTRSVDALPDPKHGESPDPAVLDPDHTQVVVFTSGTTGTPKGVRLTVGNLRSSAVASAYRLGVDPSDRWLVPLPQYHMGGFAPIIRSALYGTTIVTKRSFDPKAVAAVAEDTSATGMSVVPTMVRSLLEWGWEPSSHLRFVLVGGAPTPPDLVERALAAGVPLHPSYGASETASQVATATPKQVAKCPDTVGQPLFGTDVTIVGPNGTPVESGETGEIVVSGPTVSPGYLDPAQTAESFEDGSFHTGDVGYVDRNGTLRVTGRRSDRIVTGGETVDPTEVARVLQEHDAVVEAAVVGLPDERWGERIGAIIVPREPQNPPSRTAIERFCADRLATHKRPRTIAFVGAIPRTHSGTVDRDAVSERLAEE